MGNTPPAPPAPPRPSPERPGKPDECRWRTEATYALGSRGRGSSLPSQSPRGHRPPLPSPLQLARGVRPRVAPERHRCHARPAAPRARPPGPGASGAHRETGRGPAHPALPGRWRGADGGGAAPLPGHYRRELQARDPGSPPRGLHRPVRHRSAVLPHGLRRAAGRDALGQGSRGSELGMEGPARWHLLRAPLRAPPAPARHAAVPHRPPGRHRVLHARARAPARPPLRKPAALSHPSHRPRPHRASQPHPPPPAPPRPPPPYGRLPPFPTHPPAHGHTEHLTPPPPPWRRAYESAAERRRALLAHGREVFGMDFVDCVPLRSEAGQVEGVAYVLPFSPHFQSRQTHRVYLKDMLLSERAENLLPEWAFFVRCVVNAQGLRPTASREAFYEDATLASARDALGHCLRQYLVELATHEPRTLQRLIALHGL